MEGQNESNEPTNADQDQPPQQGMISVSREPPPTLLRINADNQSKRAICFFWILFFVVLIAMTIASSFLPAGLVRFTNQDELYNSNLQNCPNPNGFDSNKIITCNADKQTHRLGTAMINLVRENQFVIVEWVFMLADNKVQMKGSIHDYADINITINLTLYEIKSVDLNGQIGYQIIEETKKQNQIASNIVFRQSYKNYGDDDETLIAYRVPQFTVRQFYENSLLLIVELDKSVTQFPNVSEIKTQIQVVNAQFTKYTFVIRYLFFASSLIACVLYFIMLCRIPAGERILQQKIIAILSMLLVLFNDPFYPITVLYPNKASSYFSVFFIINFVIFLLLLWILFVDRIYYEDGQKQTELINIKRLGYIGVTYILALVLYTLIAMDHIDGLPVTNPENLIQNKRMVFLELATLFFIILGFAYIIFSYIRLCTRLDTLLWRNQLFLFFSTFFIVMSVAFFFVNGLSINYFMGNRILLLFTMMNMYTFYLQYMYSLSRDERGRVERGQVEAGGMGLLEVHSGDNDFVDLEFDNLSVGSKIHSDKKLQNFVDRNKKLLNQKHSDDQKQSPKYGESQEKELEYNNLRAPDGDDEKHTDFFNEDRKQDEESEIAKKQNNKQDGKKKQDEFSEFSLD